MPARPAVVYLHVGPPKTGTTFLQDVLWRNRDVLAARGLTVPGGKLVDHFHAALDLRDIAFGGFNHPSVPGSWDKLATKARHAATGRAVISHEVLAGADGSQVQTAVEALRPAEVHVVYGVRDLARQLPAVWQESLKNRRTRTFERFLAKALDADADTDRGFWRAQHPVAVLGRWAAHVPAARIHVVTLPPAGSTEAGALLWQRFCMAVGTDGAGLDLDVARTNASLSTVHAEMLRRLNHALPDDLDWPTYERLVKRRFDELADEAHSGRRPRLPGRYEEAVRLRSEHIVTALAEAGYDVVGDLADLRPDTSSFGKSAPAPPDKVADAAVELLAQVLTDSDRGESAGDRARSLLGQMRRG